MIRASLNGAAKFGIGLRKLANKIVGDLEEELYIAARNVQIEMSEEGKPIVYPVKWDTTKQRKAFFATNGFGRGIPTKRTGQGVGAWRAIKFKVNATGYSEVFNPLAHIVFINGRRQSRIHKGRWKIFHVVVKRVLKAMPDKLQKRVIATVHEQGLKAVRM